MSWLYCLSAGGRVFYIGVATDYQKRFQRHLRMANSHEWHVSRKIRKLQRLNVKIECVPLLFVESETEAFELETKYIAWARQVGFQLCNMTPGGDRGPVMFGMDNPSKRPSTKKKISDAKLGKKRPDLGIRNKNHCSKSVAQVLNNELIQVYTSVREAARQTGFGKSAIYNCCNRLSRTAFGFEWRYL